MGTAKHETTSLSDRLIQIRRDLHQHPELSGKEHRTAGIVESFLREQGIETQRLGPTGVVGWIRGGYPGKTVALRADMDALPLDDQSGVPYQSVNSGAAHACGHDGHTAILLGAASVLFARRDRLQGNVKLIFQPSEEMLPGGALPMIEAGVLEGVDAIFGLHLWQPLPFGHVGVSPGAMMAAPDEFTLCIRGKGGHASMPHQTVDAVVVAAHVVTALQTVVSRSVDPLKAAIVSVGTITAGSSYNIIADTAELKGTVRTLDQDVRESMPRRIREIAKGVCAAFGAECHLSYQRGYPPLVNHPEMSGLVLDVSRRELGHDRAGTIPPVMAGEDFAYYLERVPGAFFFLGLGTPYPHHHPKFDIDDAVVPLGVRLMSAIAEGYLNQDREGAVR